VIERLQHIAARAKAAAKLLEKLHRRTPPNAAQAAKDEEVRLSARMQLNRDLHELHCLAVEIGIAAPEPRRYGERRASLGFGRDTLESFRHPEISFDALTLPGVER
jgi:hypothetical protein